MEGVTGAGKFAVSSSLVFLLARALACKARFQRKVTHRPTHPSQRSRRAGGHLHLRHGLNQAINLVRLRNVATAFESISFLFQSRQNGRCLLQRRLFQQDLLTRIVKFIMLDVFGLVCSVASPRTGCAPLLPMLPAQTHCPPYPLSASHLPAALEWQKS